MLLARIAWGMVVLATGLPSPQHFSPPEPMLCLPCGSYYNLRYTPATAIREDCKDKVYYSQFLESTRHTPEDPHKEAVGRKRGRKCTSGILPLLGLRMGSLVVYGLTVHKIYNIRAGIRMQKGKSGDIVLLAAVSYS